MFENVSHCRKAWPERSAARLTLIDAAPSGPAPTAFHPIPGASLFGGPGSLFDRFNSLFARLGNLLYDAAEINDLVAPVRHRNAPGSGFSRYIPVRQGTQTTCSRRSVAISIAS